MKTMIEHLAFVLLEVEQDCARYNSDSHISIDLRGISFAAKCLGSLRRL